MSLSVIARAVNIIASHLEIQWTRLIGENDGAFMMLLVSVIKLNNFEYAGGH